MGVFSRLISRKKKSDVEELFFEIGDASEILEKFLKLYEVKINSIKGLITAWTESGKIGNISNIPSDILQWNRKLRILAGKLLDIDKKEKLLFYFIMKEKMHALDQRFAVYKRQKDLLDKRNFEEYRGRLQPFFDQLFDAISGLSRLLELQNKQIEQWGIGAEGLLPKDLIERKYFFTLLSDEAAMDKRIKQNVIVIIRTINEFLGYEKAIGLEIVEKDGKTKVSKGLTFHEIRDMRSINFQKFWDMYIEAFPPDERESKKQLKRYLEYKNLQEYTAGGANNHLVVAMAEGKMVAITFFVTFYIKERNICFGYGTWVIVSPEWRGKGIAPQIYDYRLKVMEKDAKLFGAKSLDGIVIEVNDPRKMDPGMIKEDAQMATDPFERFGFMHRMGFLPFNFHYIQPALEDGAPVDYLVFMLKPFKKEWIERQGIPADDMKAMIHQYIKFAFDRNPEEDATYRQMMINIDNEQVAGYITFGKDIELFKFKLRKIVKEDTEGLLKIASATEFNAQDRDAMKRTLNQYFDAKYSILKKSKWKNLVGGVFLVNQGNRIVGVLAITNDYVYDSPKYQGFLYPISKIDGYGLAGSIASKFTDIKSLTIYIEGQKIGNMLLGNLKFCGNLNLDKDRKIIVLSTTSFSPSELYRLSSISNRQGEKMMKNSIFVAETGTRGEYYKSVLVPENIIVGMGGVFHRAWWPKNLCGLGWFFVHPSVLGKGISKAILLTIEKKAKEMGFDFMFVDTDNKLVAANKFYQKNGYTKAVEISDYYGDGVSYVVYIKKI